MIVLNMFMIMFIIHKRIIVYNKNIDMFNIKYIQENPTCM